MLWNSTVAAVLAIMLTILLHETAHAVAALTLGVTPTLYPFAANVDDATPPGAQAIIAIAAPLFSLVSGVIFTFFNPFSRRKGFLHLFWLWFAFASAQEGFGYFTIAPFIDAGDTGKFLRLMQAPAWVGWLCFVFGIAGLFFLAFRFAGWGVRFARDLTEMRAFCWHAWIISTVASVLISLTEIFFTNARAAQPVVPGAAIVAVLFGSIALGVYGPMAMMFMARARRSTPEGSVQPLTLWPVPVVGLVVTAALLLLNLAVLTGGVRLG